MPDDVEVARQLVNHLRAKGLADESTLARAGAHFSGGKRSYEALVLAGVAQSVVDDALIELGLVAPKTISTEVTQAGPWRIDRLLGQGGMARVFLGHDERGRRAAIKVVHRHLLEHEAIRKRFDREARATMRVR